MSLPSDGIYNSATNTLNIVTNGTSKIQVDSVVTSTAPLKITDSTPSTTTVTGALVVTGGLGVGGSLNLGIPLAVGSGGTGVSSTPANGQIDIGNGAGFIRTTLDSGVGIYFLNTSGNINILLNANIQYLIVGGGGGGGGGGSVACGGGGGGGGFFSGIIPTLNGNVYAITVGVGGAGGTGYSAINGGAGGDGVPPTPGANGTNSSIAIPSVFSLTAFGGGGGGPSAYAYVDPAGNGLNGACGGGGASTITASSSGGIGSQGFNGGNVNISASAAGGGGVGSVGQNGSGFATNNGGDGLSSNITGSTLFYCGGGGGASNSSGGGAGGSGVGGHGGDTLSNLHATNGSPNTGSGGGGCEYALVPGFYGGNGADGVVILSIPTTHYTGNYTGTPIITTNGSNTVLKFITNGSYST